MKPIFREYPTLAAVYLFGSVSRQDTTVCRDVDLGLLLQTDPVSHDTHRFLGDLAARLEAVTAPRPVDLVVLNLEAPVFCHEVLLEGQLVYEADRERRVDFESDVVIRALDFRPTLELATGGYLPGFRRWLRTYRDRSRRSTSA